MKKHSDTKESRNKRRLWMLLGAFTAACGGQLAGPIVGGESHFLRYCSTTCGGDLSCISGVCTESCLIGQDDSCSALAQGARCLNTSVEPGDVAICDMGCQDNLDCSVLGSDYSCEGGFCRAPAPPTDDGNLPDEPSGGRPMLGTGGGSVGTGGASMDGTGASSEGNPGTGGSSSSSGGAIQMEYPGELPSCEGLEGMCGDDSCCTSLLVPGGQIVRDGQVFDMPEFYLDKFEVTVGRFRRYMDVVDAWQAEGNPVEGAGAVPLSPDTGFKRSWLEDLEPTFAVGVRPQWLGSTIEEGPRLTMGNPNYLFGDREDLPVNRVPFHIALAFCIWDGGRLPSELEWRFVAQAGAQAAPYPWGATDPAEVFAVVPTAPPPGPGLENDPEWEFLTIPVGSHPQSAGVFGHHDLASGMIEWVRDDMLEGSDARVRLGADTIIKNPFDLQWESDRVAIGSTWHDVTNSVLAGLPPRVANTGYPEVSWTSSLTGIRCARDL